MDLPAPPSALQICETDAGLHAIVLAAGSSVHLLTAEAPQPDSPSVTVAVQETAERLAAKKASADRDGIARHAEMTKREKEVLNLALKGLTARQIGLHLFIGERTVETHLAHGYSKLGVRSKVELMLRTAFATSRDR
jgi:DNA-binding CsgD family transcriptional regulator